MCDLLVQCIRGEKSYDDDVLWLDNKANYDDKEGNSDKASVVDNAHADDRTGAKDTASAACWRI